MRNIFADLPERSDEERIEEILAAPAFASSGSSRPGRPRRPASGTTRAADEWVMVLSGGARLLVEGEAERAMAPGDHRLPASPPAPPRHLDRSRASDGLARGAYRREAATRELTRRFCDKRHCAVDRRACDTAARLGRRLPGGRIRCRPRSEEPSPSPSLSPLAIAGAERGGERDLVHEREGRRSASSRRRSASPTASASPRATTAPPAMKAASWWRAAATPASPKSAARRSSPRRPGRTWWRRGRAAAGHQAFQSARRPAP